VRDEKGEIYTVRYDAVNAMLLNEFLKARRQIDAQQKQIDALTTGMSAQFEELSFFRRFLLSFVLWAKRGRRAVTAQQ
jgi:hypothetical protein